MLTAPRTNLGVWMWLLASAFACTSLVGVEELDPGPNPERGGGGSSGGRAGDAPSAAGTDGGANGGTAPAAGSSTGGSSAGRSFAGSPLAGKATTAGQPSSGGTAPGAEGGSGGTPEEGGSGGSGGEAPYDPTVTGRVIDLVGHAVPEAIVAIGDTTVQTNTAGEFTIPNVPEEYDVGIVVRPQVSGGNGEYAWVYQGLTRRNPTLHVYEGVDYQSRRAVIAIQNGGLFADTHKTVVAFGSPDGNRPAELSAAQGSAIFDWYGPVETSGRIHALRWLVDNQDLPAGYEAYATQPAALSAEGTADPQLSVDLAANTVQSAAITGAVTSTGTSDRSNLVFVRFASNASIPVVTDAAAAGTFSYLVPTIPQSVITVAAERGITPGEYSVAHEDVAPGQANIQLVIPSPPILAAPPMSATNVTVGTPFRWTSEPGVFVVHIEDTQFYQGVFVVTDSTSFTLPAVPGDLFSLRPAGPHFWQVKVSGGPKTTDEATGPQGHLDPFSFYRVDPPAGPRRGKGSFTQSLRRFFTAAP